MNRFACWWHDRPRPIEWLRREDLLVPLVFVLGVLAIPAAIVGVEIGWSTLRTVDAVVLAKSWHPDDRRSGVAPAMTATGRGMSPGFAVVSSGSPESFSLLLMVDGERMTANVWQDEWARATEGQHAEVVVRTGGLGGRSVRSCRLVEGGAD